MAKGSIAKEEIYAKLLEVFPGSFQVNSKELRINWKENGEPIQIKVALTAAKDIIGENQDAAVPFESAVQTPEISLTEPSDEEKQKLKNILASIF